MRILVTGTSGFLGKKINNIFGNKYELFGTHREKTNENICELDITNFEMAKRIVDRINPEILIHSAAIADVNFCENNKQAALNANFKATKNLAEICRKKNKKMIYISSDYVFSGEDDHYFPDSERKPINHYGLTKMLAEDSIINCLDDYAIVRPTIMYGFNDFLDNKNIITNLINQFKEDKEIVLDNRRIKYPLLIDDIVYALADIVESNDKGIFHISGSDSVTRYDFGCEIARVFNLPTDRIVGGDLKEMDRPYNINLKGGKFEVKKLVEGLKIVKKQMESMSYGNN